MELISTGLKHLYGRSPLGVHNRHTLKLSMTPETFDMISQTVEYGRGKYGSAFIELSSRFLSALLNSGEDIDVVGAELLSVSKSPYLRRNMIRFLKLMDAYADNIALPKDT